MVETEFISSICNLLSLRIKIMAMLHQLPNEAILRIHINTQVQTHARVLSEGTLLDQFCRLLPSVEESALDAMFHNTVQRITVGYAWFKRALERSGKKTFLPAVKHLREWRQLSTPVQNIVHRNMRLIKKIYEKWDTIVHNVTHQSMIYVDVRRFSLYQLSRSCSFTWLKRYNKNHAPRDTRRPDKIYTNEMVDDIVNNVAGATERALDAVDGDEDQIKLIGKDITNLLLVKADQRLNIQ